MYLKALNPAQDAALCCDLNIGLVISQSPWFDAQSPFAVVSFLTPTAVVHPVVIL